MTTLILGGLFFWECLSPERETVDWLRGANQTPDTLADLKTHRLAIRHVSQTTWDIEMLPPLLRSDVCEALSWTWP